MGFIQQQPSVVALAQCAESFEIRAGALHAEQAFADHKQRLAWTSGADVLQLVLQVAEVVMSETLQLTTAGLDTHQQGVMNQSIGQHSGVAISQGGHGSEVGLKATGEQQHGVPSQPVPKGLFKLLMHRTATGHQAGSGRPHSLLLDHRPGGLLHHRMAGQVEIVIAGEIGQSLRLVRVTCRSQPI